MEDAIALNPNPLVRHLDKLPGEFTKQDLIKFISDNNIQMVNFRYIAGDDRLKSLNFVITSRAELDRLLSTGERADGLQPLPVHRRCIERRVRHPQVQDRVRQSVRRDSYARHPVLLLHQGRTPLASAPDNILRKAHDSLKGEHRAHLRGDGRTGVLRDRRQAGVVPCPPQKGYHESPPFTRWQDLRCEAMLLARPEPARRSSTPTPRSAASPKTTWRWSRMRSSSSPVNVEDR